MSDRNQKGRAIYMRKYREKRKREVEKIKICNFLLEKSTDLYGLTTALLGYLLEVNDIDSMTLMRYMKRLTTIPANLGYFHPAFRAQRALEVAEELANKVLPSEKTSRFHKREAEEALEAVKIIEEQIKPAIKRLKELY